MFRRKVDTRRASLDQQQDHRFAGRDHRPQELLLPEWQIQGVAVAQMVG